MTSTFTKPHGLTVSCDHDGCGSCVSDRHIRLNGGLKRMGWTWRLVDGQLHHYCPGHQESKDNGREEIHL